MQCAAIRRYGITIKLEPFHYGKRKFSCYLLVNYLMSLNLLFVIYHMTSEGRRLLLMNS